MRKRTFSSLTVLASVGMLAALPLGAGASHSWGTYHWGRTANPVTVRVVDSMTNDWDDKLAKARLDWDASDVLAVVHEAGDSSSKTRKRCAAVSGKVRACNAPYGNNGWLGLAQIWISGGHIVQGVAKMNDSYLATPRYSETNRQHVMCQEIGHDWGLGHQDESGADRDTCMDYSSALDNPSPNAHDHAQLQTIYGAHLDAGNTAMAPSARFLNADARAQENWGTKVHDSGRAAVFVRNFAGGLRIVTHVTWAR